MVKGITRGFPEFLEEGRKLLAHESANFTLGGTFVSSTKEDVLLFFIDRTSI
jgi:hypothetical protein